ncbi:MAG: tetratricopeptide repeat protein [Acidobacteria bacterium]|nr:tetratricopeptide repeat protein [Acidobacteriota bacterium]
MLNCVWRKFANIVWCALLLGSASFGQATRTITGRVTDDKGETGSYINIVVVNGAGGALTKEDGSFSLDIPRKDKVTHRKAETQTVEVGKNLNSISVVMRKGRGSGYCPTGKGPESGLRSRSIKGRITDSRTNAPIPDAGVVAGGDQDHASSNYRGEFELEEIWGDVIVRISRPGYVPQEIRIAPDRFLADVSLVRRDYVDTSLHFITGRLTDSRSGQPMKSGVIKTVSLNQPPPQYKDEGTEGQAVADDSGNFSLIVPRSGATLQASFIGYDSADVFVGAGTNTVNISLKQNLPQPVAAAPATVTTSPAPAPAPAPARSEPPRSPSPATQPAPPPPARPNATTAAPAQTPAPAAPAASTNTPTADSLMGSAWTTVLEGGDLSKSIAELTLAAQRAPNLKTIPFQIAELKKMAGDLDGAAAEYRKLMEDKNAVLGANTGLCGVFLAKGKLADALASCQSVLAAGESVIVRSLLGDILSRKGDLAGAIEQYQKAISLDPRYAQAYENLSAAYKSRGDSVRAKEALAKSLELTPGADEQARAKFRRQRLVSGFVSEVADELRTAWSLDNMNSAFSKMNSFNRPTADQQSEFAALQKRRNEYLAERYRIAIKLYPENVSAHFGLWVALRDTEPEVALQSIQRAIQLQPTNVSVRLALASLYRTKGDSVAEMNTLRETVRTFPQNAEAHSALAEAWEARNDSIAALEEYRAAVQAEPNNVHQRFGLALRLRTLSDRIGSLAEYYQAARSAPNNAQARYFYGDALEKVGDFRAAIVEYRAGFLVDPTNPSAQGYLSRALEKSGDTRGAIQMYRDIAAADPKNSKPHQEIATLMKGIGDKPGALAELRIAAGLKPKDSGIQLSLGWALIDANDYKGALDALKISLINDPENSFVRDQYNQQAQRMGLPALKPGELPAPPPVSAPSAVASRPAPTAAKTDPPRPVASAAPAPPVPPPSVAIDLCPTPGTFSRPVDQGYAAYLRGVDIAKNKGPQDTMMDCLEKGASLGDFNSALMQALIYSNVKNPAIALSWLMVADRYKATRLEYLRSVGRVPSPDAAKQFQRWETEDKTTIHQRIDSKLTPEFRKEAQWRFDLWLTRQPNSLAYQKY